MKLNDELYSFFSGQLLGKTEYIFVKYIKNIDWKKIK